MRYLFFMLFFLIYICGCQKPRTRYVNYARETVGFSTPVFDVVHDVLQNNQNEYLLCGSNANEEIILMQISEEGNFLNQNASLGIGSAHQILELNRPRGRFPYLLLANDEDSFFTVLVNESGMDDTLKVDNYRDILDSSPTLPGGTEFIKAYAIYENENDEIFIAGSYKQVIGDPRFFLLKLDENFNFLWSIPIKLWYPNKFATTILQIQNTIFLAGISEDESSSLSGFAYIAAFDNDEGDFIAERTLFETSGSFSTDMVLSPDGNIILLSSTDSPDNSSKDIGLFKLSTNPSSLLNTLQNNNIGTAGLDETGYSIAATTDNEFIVYGIGKHAQNANQYAVVLTKVTENLETVWSNSTDGVELYDYDVTNLFPGAVVEADDLGFFSFSILDENGGSKYLFIKTDEVGRLDN